MDEGAHLLHHLLEEINGDNDDDENDDDDLHGCVRVTDDLRGEKHLQQTIVICPGHEEKKKEGIKGD